MSGYKRPHGALRPKEQAALPVLTRFTAVSEKVAPRQNVLIVFRIDVMRSFPRPLELRRFYDRGMFSAQMAI